MLSQHPNLLFISPIDKSPLLLLCMPPHQLTVKQSINEHSEYEMRKRPAQILDPVKDFRIYISKLWNVINYGMKISNLIFRHYFRAFRLDSKRIIENGIITQMRADWILPKEKKLEVTLKILNSESNLPVSFVSNLLFFLDSECVK